MASETLSAELIRLVAALAALFLGLAASAGVRSIRGRGDGHGGTRLAVAMVAGSVAIAAGTWVFIAIARRAANAAAGPAVPSAMLIYCAIGFAVGLASGVFPRVFGVPAIVAVAASMAIATAALAPWIPWTNRREAARVSILSADGQKTRCVVRTASSQGSAGSADMELPAGPVAMEFRVVDIIGPLSPFFGARRYLPSAVLAGSARIQLPDYGTPFIERLGRIPGGLGCSIRTLWAPAIDDIDFASASYTLGDDGSIVAVGR